MESFTAACKLYLAGLTCKSVTSCLRQKLVLPHVKTQTQHMFYVYVEMTECDGKESQVACMKWHCELARGFFLRSFRLSSSGTCAHAQAWSLGRVWALQLLGYLWCGNHWLYMTIGITARCEKGAQEPRTLRKCRKVGTRNLPQPQTTQGDPRDHQWATK